MIKIRSLVITGTDAELNRLQNEYRQWQGMDTRFDGDRLIVLPRKNRHELGKMIK